MAAETEQLCAICFCEFDGTETKYTCGNVDCSTLLCLQCIEALITFSEGKSLIPTCLNKACNEIYLVSDLKGISSNSMRCYENACFNYFLKKDSDTVNKMLDQDDIIKKIRDERLKFIEQTFPRAISFIANLAFKDRIKQLDKQKRTIIAMKFKNASKTCFNPACNGFLDADLICMKCNTSFCKKCTKKIGQNHACKQEDLDSIDLINNMIHCPGCKLPVFKNEGCDSITCSNCSTNFLYSTGLIGGHGSGNAKININIAKPIRISSEFSSKIPKESLPLILKIESLEPAFKSKDTLLTPIKNYILSQKKNKGEEQKAEKQKPEKQKAEKQKPEKQKAEKQKPEKQKAEEQKGEKQKAEKQKAEKQKPEEQKGEEQKPEEQKGEEQKGEEQKDKSMYAKDVVKNLEEYTVSRRKNIRYFKYLGEIHDLLVNSDNNKLKQKLDEIIGIIC
jgi:hypothetical protein